MNEHTFLAIVLGFVGLGLLSVAGLIATLGRRSE